MIRRMRRSRRPGIVVLAAALAVSGSVLASCSDGSERAQARANDGGSASDSDAARDVAPRGPSYCATLPQAPFLCVDFDDGAAPAEVFTSASGASNDNGSLRVVSDGVAGAFVLQEADPSPKWSTIDLGFVLRIDAVAADARAIIARIGQHQTDVECRVDLQLDPNGLSMRTSAGAAALVTKKLAKGASSRILLTLDASSTSGTVVGRITVDGQPAIATPLVLGCARLPGPPRVSLGRLDGAGNVELHFDDVVFDGR
jgi:hypothetical protein